MCPKCGSDRIVNISPAIPGPDGWGGRCKVCGHRWSIDIPGDVMPPEVDYVVLLYPPHGPPRVVEVPHATPEVAAMIPVERFDTKAKAEAALEKFLTEHPEYRQWRDGCLIR